MEKFSFHWQPIKLTAERLIIEGTLDRSIEWNADVTFRRFKDELRSKSVGKIIVIDLTKFGTWDTEGIEETIKKLIEPLVSKGARIGICGLKRAEKINPKATGFSQVYEDAKLKQAIVDSEQLPWEDSIDEVLRRLKA